MAALDRTRGFGSKTGDRVKFLARFMCWATLAFFIAWHLHPAWEHAVAAIGARLAAPRGSEIEIVDLELFYPFDIGVFVALCLASVWAPRARRLKAAAIGIPILFGIEVLSLVAALKVMMSSADADLASRFANAVIRVSGLVAASAAWLYLLGRERLSLASRKWLGS